LSKYQDLAENVYKDSTLSSYFKFDKAINILKSFCDLENTRNSRTLGIAGAVYRSKWKFDHQFHNLLQSRAYYKKGYLIWKNKTHKTVHTEYLGYIPSAGGSWLTGPRHPSPVDCHRPKG